MSEKPSPLLPDDEQSRDLLRAALVLLCAVAVVLAGTVVPAVSGAGLGSTPLGSVVPKPNVNVGGLSGGGGPGGSGLGALNPREQTSVGGSLGSGKSAFQSQATEVHFVAKSSASSYWRTGAYDIYTGSGWKKSGDRKPYSGPIEGDGMEGRKVEYEVTLSQSASSLPSIWRAESVSRTDSLFVTDQRALVTDTPVPAGTTYRGVSNLPPRDPTVLKAAGRDYPAELERRYTALPDDSQRRVGNFTDRLTSDANSPYESAKRIESWLESNKNYSLNVTPPSEDVASQFIFEMERGYCEYFATSMTAMLRSQGIPARYVVGYSTGQQVGANTYKVRAMNAHAWVEVYFPEVGWVRFDPTPGSARLQAEQQAFQNQTESQSGEYDHGESGSPGEQFWPNQSATPETNPGRAGTTTGTTQTTTGGTTGQSTATSDQSTETPGETPTPNSTATRETVETTIDAPETTTATAPTTTSPTTTPPTTTSPTTTPDESDPRSDDASAHSDDRYEVELNRTPVPGATVRVTVSRNDTRVADRPVFFNDERVGVTDDAGRVTAEVPYARNLTITVGTDSAATEASAEAPPTLGTPPPDLDVPMALAGPPPVPASYPRSLSPGNGTNETEYALATNATLAVSGDVAAGNKVVVTATVSDVPVRDAEVRVDGERVGTTDRKGRIRVRLPDSPGNVTVSVSRGPVSGETTVTIPRLAVSVDPSLPVALPGFPAEICATADGSPVTAARVRVGDVNLTTDFDGSASVALPFRSSATVVVSARGQTRRTTVSGLFVNLAGVLAGAALVLGGLGYGAARRGLTPRRLAALLFAGLRAIPGLAVAALFWLADRLEWAVQTLLDAIRDLSAGRTTLRELLDRLQAWLTDRAAAAKSQANLSLEAFGTGPSLESPPSTEQTDDADDSYRTLREAWHAFLGTVSVRRPDSMTPGELAGHAVYEDDLPPEAVATLRDAFRDVEYGAQSPAERLAHVEEAIEAIEERAREQAREQASEADSDGEAAALGGDD